MSNLPKLPKGHAERALKTLIGSAAGMVEPEPGHRYFVSRGTLFVKVCLEEMWPYGVFIRGDFTVKGDVLKSIYLNRDNFEPDWEMTAKAERLKARERR
ncbi:hypothetical protein [Paenibacillus macerans]|uniref:hypothetical protein n=1 Tax=Paenibacillus macerans TaxID=44252 RepID=UPI00203F08EA|nr:hypothetical protein [Paenibacillus macerans]MCM3699238.1 hypothetical protein [Paenibacillus macerans]